MAMDTIQSVDRALKLLIYLCREGRECGITQIAEDMDEYKSTIFRTLSTLEARGFIKKNPDTERYWLGERLFTLGKAVEVKMGFTELIRPYARRLHENYHEVVNVSILERNLDDVYRSVIILKENSERNILTVDPPVGSSSECYNSAVGKCLLAFSEDIDLEVYRKKGLKRYTVNTISTVDALCAELEKIRVEGYAMDQEELELGLSCIGAPILDQRGFAVAAISLTGPTSRMLTSDLYTRINAVRKVAQEISSII